MVALVVSCSARPRDQPSAAELKIDGGTHDAVRDAGVHEDPKTVVFQSLVCVKRYSARRVTFCVIAPSMPKPAAHPTFWVEAVAEPKGLESERLSPSYNPPAVA